LGYPQHPKPMAAEISTGSIPELLKGCQDTHTDFKPIVQVLQATVDEMGIWHLIISDGGHHAAAVLGPGLHKVLPTSHEGIRFCLVRLHSWKMEMPGADVVEVRDMSFVGNCASAHGPPAAAGCGLATADMPKESISSTLERNQRMEGPGADERKEVPTPRRVPTPLGLATLDQRRLVAETVDEGKQGHAPVTSPFPQNVSSGPPPRAQTRGMSATDFKAAPVMQLSAISIYTQAWRIRVRIVSKTNVRQFVNKRGTGQMFSLDGMDSQAQKTRATFFSGAVDKYYNMLNVHQIFEIAGGTVRTGNPRFCPYPLEFTFDGRCFVEAVMDDGSIPRIKHDPLPLAQIHSKAPGDFVDVAGVVLDFKEPTVVATRVGINRRMRRLTLADDSRCPLLVHVWGSSADEPLNKGDVVFVKRARVTDFNGRSLDATQNPELNPDDPRAFQLRKLFSELSANFGSSLISSPIGLPVDRQTLSLCIHEGEGRLQCGAASQGIRHALLHRISPVTVTKLFNDRSLYYFGCMQDVEGRQSRCKRKVLPCGQMWQCSSGHVSSEPTPLYSFKVEVADASASLMVGVFGDDGTTILGLPAAELAALCDRQETGDTQAADQVKIIHQQCLMRRWSMVLQSRRDEYAGSLRVARTVQRCSPLDIPAEALEMLRAIRSMR